MKDDETYSDAETERRREAALKRMLNTPHKPHDPLKSKSKPSRPMVEKAKGSPP